MTPVTPVTPVTPAAAQSTPTLLTTLMWMMIWLWIAAMLVLIGYSIYSYVKMRRLVDDACLVRDNIYETDRIRTPFILGLVRPRIYIPTGLQGEQLNYVLAHESYHLRRHDNIVKTFAFLLMAVHWFNPLVWLAFHLMTRDMEMSCDEAVLSRREGTNKMYSTTLLSFAAPSHFPAATPLCFGESSVKSRIKNALSWRKPKIWVTLVSIVLCITALAACATNPVSPKSEAKPINAQTEKTGQPAEPNEPTNPVEPANPVEGFAVKITDLGNDTFHVEDAGFTAGLDLTVKLPESWAGRYTYQIYDTAISFYCKAAYETSYDEGYHGYLCGIWVRDEVMSPDDPLWGDSRVLAVADNYSVVLSCPGDVQFTAETEREYRDMDADRDEVEITMSEQMLANAQIENDSPQTAPPEDFAVKVAYLGNETFRVKDAGFTPGLDLTVKLPESWADRYTHLLGSDAIYFCCKATYEKSYNEGYHGNLCGIWVRNEVMSPDEPLWGDSRVLAVADSYSVVLICPGDVQYTAETEREYQDMYADIDKVEITMSEQMLANTWNEANPND